MTAGRAVACAVALLAACLLAAACGPRRSVGEKLWRARCARCHGIDGAGNTPRYMGTAAADLRDDTWRHGGDSGTMAMLVKNGIPGAMPGNPDLTDEQVRAIVTYLRQLRGESY